MKKTIIGIAVCGLLSSGCVQTKPEGMPEKPDLPGNTTLPSSVEELDQLAALETGNYKYSVEDYFRKTEQSKFRISPDGLYFSYQERDENGKMHVYVKHTETGEIKRIIEEKDELIRWYGWVNENRIVYIMDYGGDENYHLFAVDLDGSNNLDLTPFDGVRVNFTDLLKDYPDDIIISMNKDDSSVFEPYRINVYTGVYTQLFENPDPIDIIAGYAFDKDGQLKGYYQQHNGTEYIIYYRTAETNEFKQVIKTTWKDTFYILEFNYVTENPHDAFVLSNLDSDTAEIILYDFEKQEKIKTVYRNDSFDAGGLSLSRKRGYEVDYYTYTGVKQQTVPVSSTFRKLHERFTKKFAAYQYYIASQTDEEDKYLICVKSDRLYGIYYVYDAVKDTFIEILNLRPKLDEADMAEMRPVEFTSRDGLTLRGYLTVPNAAANGRKVPLIVNPHGGPYGVRNRWRFNSEAQLFASRGYATLQLNYRGSGGYGKTFFLAGSKQIGRKMLDDLEDGVEYVKSLGIIDENRIAIYGGSYGGLATLGSLVKTPDLYTCGVDYVGVANLFTFIKTLPPYWKPWLEQFNAQWYDENDPAERKIMEAVSPALNVEKINKPLFVIQGANDARVNINESDQMVENLRARGFEVPYMVKYDEGHGFGHEHNRLEMYKCMMGFFARHLNQDF